MKNLLLLLLVLLFSASLSAETLQGTVYWVGDGDTFIMGIGDRLIRIRIWGIDAPEKQMVDGDISTAILKNFIEGKRVTCINKGEHRNRIVAQVFYRQRDVALELLKMGAVWWSDKYAPDQEDYKITFNDAIKNKRGLWAFGTPEPPWQWRKLHKEIAEE
ncbi:MAG: thermonuclease family protein [Victivallales bacterium]|nr:thermonuclease family protein [Victivallales bacterium]